MSDPQETGSEQLEYTVTVRISGEQGAMEAADLLAGACLEIQAHPEVESVKSTMPEPTDFKDVRADGGEPEPLNLEMLNGAALKWEDADGETHSVEFSDGQQAGGSE